METKKTTSHILKGIIIAVLYMMIDFIVEKKGEQAPVFLRYLPAIIMAGGVILSCFIFGRQTGGHSTFGDVFAHGFKTTAVFTFLVAVYAYIMIQYVFPPTEKDIQAAMATIQQQGNVMPQEVRKMAVDASKHAWVITVSGGIFASLICGLVGSLIGAAIAKKKS
ncbi:MAG TPA: DUF4199 domain-containing protein [Chitinophagaceae bacterium]|jgi:hypothetical protein